MNFGKHFKGKGFSASILKLMSGSTLAQAVTMLSLPLITRLYTPEDFKLFAAYAGGLAIISCVACLRYETAIALPEKDEDGVNLFAISLLATIFVSLISLLLIMINGGLISRLLLYPSLERFLWLFPVSVFFGGVYLALQHWAARKNNFSAIAITKIEQSIGGVSTQLVSGFFNAGVVGLFLGQLVNNSAGSFRLGRRAWINDGALLKKINLSSMIRVAKRYSKFPKYAVLESLSGSASLQLPMLLLAMKVAGPEAGYMFVALKIMQVPLSLIGGAISQVYLPHAAVAFRKNELGQLTAGLVAQLLNIGVGPIIFVGLLAPIVFPVFLGNSWGRSGVMVQWMVPWLVFQLLVSPISIVVNLVGRHNIALTLNIMGVVIRFVPLLLAIEVRNFGFLFEIFSVASAIYYFVWFVFCLKFSEVKYKQADFLKGMALVCVWFVSGLVLRAFALEHHS